MIRVAMHCDCARVPSDVAAPDSALSPDVVDVTWQWVRLTTPVEQLDVDAPDKYTVRFGSDGKVALKADCNRGMGSYSVSPDRRLALKPVALSRAMCPPGSLSDRFAKEVGRATSYFVKDGDLFLELPVDSGTLRFRRQA
jgi:heat shock protein HslJ